MPTFMDSQNRLVTLWQKDQGKIPMAHFMTMIKDVMTHEVAACHFFKVFQGAKETFK